MKERENNKYFVHVKEFKEKKKSPFIAAILSFFFGMFGIHRFYLKRKITGTILLITLVFAVIKDILALALVLMLLSFIEGIFYVTRGILLLKEKYTEKLEDNLDVTIKKDDRNISTDVETIDVAVKKDYLKTNIDVEIIDVTDIKPITIPRINELENKHYNQWTKKLELPYERRIMTVGQVKDETIKFYEKLCDYLDDELRKNKSSINKEIKRLNARGGYYDNILYTIYCISEGHVTKAYSGNYNYYNPDYSYRILESNLGRDIRNKIFNKAQELEKNVAPPNDETLLRFNLTKSGLPRRWWDIDGKLRADIEFNKKEVNILNATPQRNTIIWNIYSARKQIINLYLLLWECISIGLEKDIKWTKKKKDNLKKIVNGESIYYADYENGDILASLIKILENAIREAVPNTQILNVVNEQESIKKYLPNEVVIDINNRIIDFKNNVNLKEIEGILIEMITENPDDWKTKVERILIADVNTRANILINYRDDENFTKIAKEIIKKIHDEDILLLALYGIELKEKLSQKNNKLLENILHSANIHNYKEILNTKKELSEELFEQLIELKDPIRKKIKLDMSKVEVTKKELNETVNIVKEYIGENDEKVTVVMQDEAIVENNNDNSDFKYSNFLNKILDSGSMDIEDGKKFAMSNGTLLNVFISEVNRELYDYTQDQTLIIEDDYIKIDDFYVDIVRELIANET